MSSFDALRAALNSISSTSRAAAGAAVVHQPTDTLVPSFDGLQALLSSTLSHLHTQTHGKPVAEGVTMSSRAAVAAAATAVDVKQQIVAPLASTGK